MNSDRIRAGSAVVVVTLVAGFARLAVDGQTVQGTPADEQAIRDLVALHASASQQDDLEGWSWAYTPTPIRVVPTAAF